MKKYKRVSTCVIAEQFDGSAKSADSIEMFINPLKFKVVPYDKSYALLQIGEYNFESELIESESWQRVSVGDYIVKEDYLCYVLPEFIFELLHRTMRTTE